MKKSKAKLDSFWVVEDLKNVKKSINAKTERSEQDVIKTLSWTIAALFVLQLLDLVISIASI